MRILMKRIAGLSLRLRGAIPAALWSWGFLWLLAVAAILFGIVRLDYPLALMLRERTIPSREAMLLVRLPEAMAAVAILGTVALGAWHLGRARLRGAWRSAFFAGLGLCIALAVKAELKPLFGRVAPEAWFRHQSAPFRNFHLLHPGSFPSGHMVVLGVLAAFAWPLGLAARLVTVLGCLATGAALMIVEAHFLTDLAAGLLLGASIGAACRAAARQEPG